MGVQFVSSVELELAASVTACCIIKQLSTSENIKNLGWVDSQFGSIKLHTYLLPLKLLYRLSLNHSRAIFMEDHIPQRPDKSLPTYLVVDFYLDFMGCGLQ